MTVKLVKSRRPAEVEQRHPSRDDDSRTEYAAGRPAFRHAVDVVKARRFVSLPKKGSRARYAEMQLRPQEEREITHELHPVRVAIDQHRQLPAEAKQVFDPAHPSDPRAYINTPPRLRTALEETVIAAIRQSRG